MPTEIPSIDVIIDNSAVEAALSESINTVAIVGGAVSGTTGAKQTFINYSQAEAVYGLSNDYNHLTNLIKLAFQNGAKRVIGLKAGVGISGTPIPDVDYNTQLTTLLTDETVRLVLLDTTTSTSITNLATHVNTAIADEKFRIGLVGMVKDETISNRVAKALTLNNKALILMGGTLTIGGVKQDETYTAAAYAGYLSGQRRPVINTNYRELVGFDGLSASTSFTNANLETLIAGGVTPVIVKSGVIQIVRGVTTSTLISALPSTLYHDVSSINIEQYLAWDLTTNVLPVYLQGTNTATTRKSIANAIDMKMNGYDFIDSFNPTVVDAVTGTSIQVTVAYVAVNALHTITLVLQKILA